MKKIPTKKTLILLFGLITSPWLLAHNSLTDSVPGDQATLHQSPEFIELRFSDETYLNAVSLVNINGEEVEFETEVTKSLSRYFQIPVPILEPGSYKFTWQVEGMDTHKINGDFEFSVMDRR